MRYLKKILILLACIFLLMNVLAYIHAYKFTHFYGTETRTADPDKLSRAQKIKTLLLGINNPRPVNTITPNREYETLFIGDLECWRIKIASAKGFVIMFHGFAGKKSSLLDRAYEFNKMGYSVLLVDFLGSGGSKGNSTSIGYHEAEQVKTCVDFVMMQGEKNIFLFGTSMGAAAILKAVCDYTLHPSGIILECPFGSLYKTTCARFNNMHVPSFPFAAMLIFWGGAQNGYWAFGHNPSAYAMNVTCPVLLLYGKKDDRVSYEETEAIYSNLKGAKTLKVHPAAGHNDLFGDAWIKDVTAFTHSLGTSF